MEANKLKSGIKLISSNNLESTLDEREKEEFNKIVK